MELKTRGVSTHEIGRKLGITVSKASAAVAKSMAKLKMLPEYEKEVARQLELVRLDDLWNTLYPRATGDEVRMVMFDGIEVPVKDVDYQALKYVLEISRDRRKILDLDVPATKAASDAPTAVQVNVSYVSEDRGKYMGPGNTVTVSASYEEVEDSKDLECLPSPSPQADQEV